MRQGAAGSSLPGRGSRVIFPKHFSTSISGKSPNEISENKGPETNLLCFF